MANQGGYTILGGAVDVPERVRQLAKAKAIDEVAVRAIYKFLRGSGLNEDSIYQALLGFESQGFFGEFPAK